jgi:hypothetical protein
MTHEQNIKNLIFICAEISALELKKIMSKLHMSSQDITESAFYYVMIFQIYIINLLLKDQGSSLTEKDLIQFLYQKITLGTDPSNGSFINKIMSRSSHIFSLGISPQESKKNIENNYYKVAIDLYRSETNKELSALDIILKYIEKTIPDNYQSVKKDLTSFLSIQAQVIQDQILL